MFIRQYRTDVFLMHMQTWCRGKKLWESELLCMDCHNFTWRAYKDPDFKTPEEYEREKWEAIIAGEPIATAG